MTHSMRKSTGETGDVFTVGIWTGSGWNSVKDFPDGEDAAAFCNYLNGGDGKPFNPHTTVEQSAPAPEPEEPEPEPTPEPQDEDEDDFEDTPRPSISAARKTKPAPKRR